MISLFKKETIVYEELKHTCKVCGKQFELKKDNKYVVAENKGLSSIANGYKYFECFDCPECGCQNIVNIREGNDGKDKENNK